MKVRVVLAAILLAASASTAMAAGPYLGASAGVSIIHDSDVSVPGFGEGEGEYETGYGVNLAFGYDFDSARLEAEVGYKAADLDGADGDATFMSYMVNGFYDFKTGTAVTPFVGVGLGMINGDYDFGPSVDDTVVGFQGSVGAAIKLSNNLNLDISYRYQTAVEDFDLEGAEVSYDSSNILAGIRYKF